MEPRTRRLDLHEDLVEEYLAEVVFSNDPRLADLVEAMRRSLLQKEDRLRSTLCLEVACTCAATPPGRR